MLSFPALEPSFGLYSDVGRKAFLPGFPQEMKFDLSFGVCRRREQCFRQFQTGLWEGPVSNILRPTQGTEVGLVWRNYKKWGGRVPESIAKVSNHAWKPRHFNLPIFRLREMSSQCRLLREARYSQILILWLLCADGGERIGGRRTGLKEAFQETSLIT